jgi:hypothetical protein
VHALRGSFTLLRPPFLSSPADLRLGAGRGRLAHGALVRRGCSTALTHHLAAVRNQLSALFQKRGSVVLEGGSVLPQLMIDRSWLGWTQGGRVERASDGLGGSESLRGGGVMIFISEPFFGSSLKRSTRVD